MENDKPTVARIALVLAMTDGTIRIIETDGSANGTGPAVHCSTDTEAAQYLLDTSAICVNPAWYNAGTD